MYKEPNSLEIVTNVPNQNVPAQTQTHNKVNQIEKMKKEEKSEIQDDKEIEKVQKEEEKTQIMEKENKKVRDNFIYYNLFF